MKKDNTKAKRKQLTEKRVREIAREEIQKELKKRLKLLVIPHYLA